MRERRWLLLALYGLLLASAVAGALKATRPKFKIATTTTTSTTTEEPDVADNENGHEATTVSSDVNATTGHTLTGIPQIDYIWDPNLPRELNGFNLSEYPFYSGIPEEITFKCDGLHDGFYASVAHKCQVYHHCLFGTRYDFLCANFTAFDQRTFICHFASEVDCANSKKYWHRNDALYKTAETTTTSTSTTSTTTTSTTAAPPPARRPGRISGRRPFRRRPAYDYYDEDYYDDQPGYERTRPRGYDRRDDYDYEDRKYTRRDRERDRDFRDRDYRDRDIPSRTRDPDRPLRDSDMRPSKDERDPYLGPRGRLPARNNRRDPPASRDNDEPRNRNREPDQLPVRPRDPEDSMDEKKASRHREVDDHRYSDKGFRDDYEDEPIATGQGSSVATPEVFVKPSAPVSSVYTRPRAAPKIRRPVPLAEQEKFSYKVTAAPQTTAEPRRRTTEVPLENDYYEDEFVEEVRPQRPVNRRRPGFRDFYENPRERERDRDRPFRPRYRDDEEDDTTRPRKHPERNRKEEANNARPRKQPERHRNEENDEVRPRKHGERNRERYYERGPERGRDRSLDRPKERGNGAARHQEMDRPSLSGRDREKDNDRTRPLMRPKEVSELPESTRRPNIYDRTSVAPPTTSSVEPPKESVSSHHIQDRPFRTGNRQESQNQPARNTPTQSKPETKTIPDNPAENLDAITPEDADRQVSPKREEAIPKQRENIAGTADRQRNEPEEYSSEEYYDEPEYQPTSPPPPPPTPRTAIRIVKRPFLPSRGGNPNPRGLSLVGVKATEPPRREETINDDDRRTYDAYKFIQTDVGEKSRADEHEQVLTRPSLRKPDDEDVGAIGDDNSATLRNIDKGRNNENEGVVSHSKNDNLRPGGRVGNHNQKEETPNDRDKSVLKWNSDEFRQGQRGDVRHDNENNSGGQNRGKTRVPVTENSGYYSDTYANNDNDRDSPTGPPGNNKPIVNEVVTHHRLQDIPESEYDVTLNEALTPAFGNQEGGNLPSGFVLPTHRQLTVRDPVLQSTENSYKVSRPYIQQSQQQEQLQQKTFVPSPQFLPLTEIGNANNNERSRSVQYFRTPEAVHVTGPQYRHQRGPWHDYTGY